VAFVEASPALGVALLALWADCAVRLARTNLAPLHLVIVPLIAVTLRLALVGPACDYSRNRAMDASAPLIRDLEHYREVHGEYPRALSSVWEDYPPSVRGVDRYHYEPSGDAYNLYFEHLSDRIGTNEFFMYNKHDQQQMTSHNSDLLRRSSAELALRRGYYEVQDASRPHWKRFFFD